MEVATRAEVVAAGLKQDPVPIKVVIIPDGETILIRQPLSSAIKRLPNVSPFASAGEFKFADEAAMLLPL